MSHRNGTVLAAALLCLVAGCLSAPLLAPAKPHFTPQVVAGSVNGVSTTLQDLLAESGIAVIEKREQQGVRLVGLTRSGKPFALHLLRAKAVKGDRTLVAVQWNGEPDEPFWETVRHRLDEMKPPQEDHG